MKIQKTWPLLFASLFLAAPAALQAANTFTYATNSSQGTAVVKTFTGSGAVTVSNFVTGITNSAFANATSQSGVTSITIPSSVTNIGENAFYNCTALTSASIAGATAIGYEAFAGCTALTSLTVTAATNIGGYAFGGCTSLTSVTLPSTVASLGATNETAFDQCYALTAINVAAANPYYSSSNGVVYNSNKTVLVECPCGLGGRLTIPSTVTTIGSEAFGNNANLTNILVPASVTNIQHIAFEFGASLAKVCFAGNAPVNDGTIFTGDTLTVFYLTNTTGWSNNPPLWDGELSLPWNTRMQMSSLRFPAQTNYFGFTITGPTNFNAVVQVCTNLGNPEVWTPIWTNLLTNAAGVTNGTGYFSELGKTNVYWSGRFYNVFAQ